MKRNLKLGLLLAGMLTVLTTIAAVNKKQNPCLVQKCQSNTEEAKGVTTFVLFKVIS